MLNFIRREPALVVGLVLAALGLLAAFGLTITEEQKAAIVAFIGAVLALLGAGVTRSKVTPYRRRTTSRTVPTRNEGGYLRITAPEVLDRKEVEVAVEQALRRESRRRRGRGL